jgi:hypothetical protein
VTKAYDWTPAQLKTELITHGRNLTIKTNEYKGLCEAYAAAERDYSMAFESKATVLRIEGMPVTIIERMVKGDKMVADLRYKRDVAKGVMKACESAMNNIRVVIQLYQSILKAEIEERNLEGRVNP